MAQSGTVPLDDLPDWLPGWCLDHLGGEPAGVLFQLQQVSMVFGLRLTGGTDVVVKARADEGRAVSWWADTGRRPAMRARLRRLRGAEHPVARSAGVGGARLGQPGVAAGGGAGGSGEWVVRQ